MEETKICFKCQKELPLEDYYKHKTGRLGRAGKCKECTKSDMRAKRLERREYYRAFDKERSTLPHRYAARVEYAKSKRGRDVHRQVLKKGVQRYPEKYKAHMATGNAIRDGRLIPLPCEVCNSNKVQAHHPDYSKPLEVVWLCFKHHLEAHGKQVRSTIPGHEIDISKRR